MQMYDEDVVCFFVNKLTPKINKNSLMTHESILDHLCAPNEAHKLCTSSTSNEVQNGVQNGAQMGCRGEFVS